MMRANGHELTGFGRARDERGLQQDSPNIE
jgi:hypothetical protein